MLEWEHSISKKNKEYETVETALTSEIVFCFTDEACLAKYNETQDARYMLSKTHLVVRKNTKIKETDGFLMTVVPDLAYLEATNFAPFEKNSYLGRDKKLSGYVFYHDMDGNFANGWRYKDGVPYTMTPEDDSFDGNLALRSGGCETFIISQNELDCTYYSEWESGVLIEVGIICEWVTHTTLMTFCDNDSGGGNGGNGGGSGDGGYLGGGGSGGSGGSGGTPTTTPSAKLIEIASQISLNSDGIKALNDVLAKLLGRKIVDVKEYLNMYNELISKNAKFSDIKLNPSGTEGNYNPETSELNFKSNNSINEAFEEEFIHFYQNNTYPWGINQYVLTTGHNNIDFEAKLLIDIFNVINPLSGYGYIGTGQYYGNQYLSWLTDVTLNYTHIPNYAELNTYRWYGGQSFNYWTFLMDFNANHGNYPINNNLKPKLFDK
jgi:uncharacterized membrane protein YgcG